jgi:glucose-6-phosphate dehydrogenase assembly protein OpcA
MSAAVVKPEKLLKDLGALWVELGKEEAEGSDRSAGVLRAVTMTFVLGVEEGEDEALGMEALAQLMHEHPSRAIVVKLRKEAGAVLEGRAYAQCWMPFGRRQQICCEQVELSAGAEHIGDVVSLLRGLVAPDLPVVFWCRSGRLFGGAAYEAIAGMAHKVIVDTRAHASPRKSLEYLQRQVKAGRLYGDLTWTRLTRWRQTIANAFERLDCREFTGKVQRVTIGYMHEPEPLAAVYLAAWVKMVLGGQVEVERRLVGGEGTWQIREVRFAGGGEELVVERAEKSLVEVRRGGFSTRSVFELLGEAGLVREELAILERDPIFARVLETAAQI